jgi:hypothetical protein
MKLRGYYSPRFFIPVLKETVQDPSPVIYGEPGGPERERTLATSLTDAQRDAILVFMDKAYDQAHRGWSRSKLADGPILGWFLDRARAGDPPRSTACGAGCRDRLPDVRSLPALRAGRR